MRCPHCFIAMQTPDCFDAKDIKYEDAIKIIDYYHGQGIQQIVPNANGDVLLYPRYQEVVSYINQKVSKKPWLVTNGIELEKHTSFITENLCEVMISLDSTKAEDYAAFRGLNDERIFHKVVNNIDNLVKVKKSGCEDLPVWINCVITSDRCHEIPAMIRFATELGVDGVRFTNFHKINGQVDSPVTPLDCKAQKPVEILREVVRQNGYKVSILLPTIVGHAKPPYSCRMLSTIVIGHEGNFSPCCRINPSVEWGNFFQESELHNNVALRTFRKSFFNAKCIDDLAEPCRTCCYLSQKRPAFIKESDRWIMSDAF